MFNVAGIERFSIVDGEGWRYVIFFQGCSHQCEGCHNPETWEFSTGKVMTEEDILNDLQECDADRVLDITLSGGDPFFQAEQILNLCKTLKEIGYNIWAYTGFDFEDFLNYKKNKDKADTNTKVTKAMVDLLKYIDVLVDGRFILCNRTMDLSYRGSTNQRLIDVQKSLKRKKTVLYDLED